MKKQNKTILQNNPQLKHNTLNNDKYLLLLREYVIQNNEQTLYKNVPFLSSWDKLNKTILAPKLQKDFYNNINLNSAHSINLNYITHKIDNTKQLIPKTLFRILKQSTLDNESNILLNNQKEDKILKVFLNFKPINSKIYDSNAGIFKPIFLKHVKEYETIRYKQNYNIDGANIANKIFISNNNVIIYLEKNYIDFFDFFEEKELIEINLLPNETIFLNIEKKLANNIFFNYLKNNIENNQEEFIETKEKLDNYILDRINYFKNLIN
jgi:hypothetical protein